MDPRKPKAKQLIQNKQFSDAKKLMVQMYQDGNQDYKFLAKLGDISMTLNQLNDALKYYQQSLDKNSDNSLIYLKIGNLLHEKFNDYNKAKKMYEKCIKLSPNNEKCLFHYGKLLFQQNELIKAEECFIKCHTPRACVYYHYSLLLLSKSSNKQHNQNKALDLLFKATQIQPNISKYHYKYALCSADLALFHQADKAFNVALKLDKYKDIELLYDYAMFLAHSINNYKSALKYFEMALNCTKHPKYPLKYSSIQREYDSVYNFIQQKHDQNINNDNNIKLIIYDFDKTITYWNLWEHINGDINNLNCMSNAMLINDIYGGADRIDRLHTHFHRILSSENQIRIAIISFNHANIIISALKRLSLLQYFDTLDIIGSDSSKYLNQCKSKLNDVIELANKYKLNLSTQVLFIDDNLKNIKAIQEHCITYHVFSNYTLNGLSMGHMKEIEQLVGVYIADEYDIKPPSNRLALSIRQINKSVYLSIKKEIGGVPEASIPINSLSVIQFIKTNWTDHSYQEHFLYFAKMFKLVRKYRQKRSWWINANILPKLRDMVIDAEINRRYAVSLADLHHDEQAEKLFKEIIGNSFHYLHKIEYAYFLMRRSRYIEAHDLFEFIVNNYIHKPSQKSSIPLRSYLGYAEVLSFMEQPNKAEKYYKLAINYGSMDSFGKGERAYYKYGHFLYNQARYKESLKHFEIAFNIRPSAYIHYTISKPMYQLKMFKEYEYHLKKALKIDPSFYDARQALNEYYYNQQMLLGEEKDSIHFNNKKNDEIIERGIKLNEQEETIISEIVKINVGNNVYNNEFDRIWFDVINILTAEFNSYYDRFVKNNMNDIRYLVFADKIESELKTKIKVCSLQNIQLIMTNINNLRREYEKFVNALNECKLKEYYQIFAVNGIYTIESLRFNVKCKQDIGKLIAYYNNNNVNVTKQCNENDNDLMEMLFHFAQQCNHTVT